MIGWIKGTVEAVLPGKIIIENNGIGYEIHVPDTSAAVLKSGTKEIVTVYTVMAVREDDISLYGFANQGELSMFNMLTSVNGVGAKAALAILSVLTAEEISKAILFEDAATLSKAQGVGKKIAQRIVLELKDKVGDFSGFTSGGISVSTSEVLGGDARTEALEALIALGYSKSEAGEVLVKIKDEFDTAEEYIKAALKRLV